MTAILSLNIQGVRKNDVQTMLQDLDVANAGHFCYHVLATKLGELAQDPKHEALLRRIASICMRKGAPYNTLLGLRQSFTGIDKDGRLPMPRFRSHLQSIVSGLNEAELGSLEVQYRLLENKIDVKRFVEELFAAHSRKPLQRDRLASPAPGPAPSPASAPLASGIEAAATLAKSIHDPEPGLDRIAALSQIQQRQIAQLKEDNSTLQKENKELQQRISQLERMKPDAQAKPAELRDSRVERSKRESGKREEGTLVQYSAKVAELEAKNFQLMRQLETECKPQVTRHKADIEKLKSDIKYLKLENLKLESQIEKMLKRPMDNVEKKNELDALHDTKLKEQQTHLNEALQDKQALEARILALEQSKLVHLMSPHPLGIAVREGELRFGAFPS
jgi:hypothetical protein